MKRSESTSGSSFIIKVAAIASALTLVAIGIAGCGKSEPKPPPKVKDTVFGDLVDTKERARIDAEKAVETHKRQLEEAVKKQEEGAAQ